MKEQRRTADEENRPGVDVRGRRVLVVGLARSGRAAAHAFRRRGAVVTVTDSRPPSAFASEIPKLLSARIGLELGLHRPETFLRQDLIVVSPGVPWDLPHLVAARQHKVRVVPEVEAASWFLKGKLLGITGSNGKTTTTMLLGRMLEASGFDTFVGGNIGVPLISAVDQTSADSVSVAELSSFQLEAVQNFRVNVAVLLNITPNHLDRHRSFDAYLLAKAGIFRNQPAEDCAVLNADDPTVMSLAPAIAGRKVLFSLCQNLPDGVLVSKGKILYRVRDLERVLMDVADVKLRGAFNLENVLAATAAACVSGARFEVLPRVVREFRGVEHRLEFVRQVRGVDFYNDSKATSVDATVKAVSAFERGVYLILGGKDKGAPYGPLRPLLEKRVRRVLVIGAAAGRIAEELAGAADIVHAGDLETAVQQAFRTAVPGDTVLLAPACASFDQFRDFEHRGRVFKEVVERLAQKEKYLSREPQVRGPSSTSVMPATGEDQVQVGEPGRGSPEAAKGPVELLAREEPKDAVCRAESGGQAPDAGEEARDWRSIPERPAEARVLSRPELVSVYEIAAEELASMPWQESQEEIDEELEIMRSPPTGSADNEPFLYEVGVGSRISDVVGAPHAQEGATPHNSRIIDSKPRKFEQHGGGGQNPPAGSSGQRLLFEGSEK